MSTIKIPKFAVIKNYRTMTKEKKDLAVQGKKLIQLEWMKEEINEFYEAIFLEDKKEFNKAFKNWKKKKTLKGQAKGVTAKSLEEFAKLYS